MSLHRRAWGHVGFGRAWEGLALRVEGLGGFRVSAVEVEGNSFR